MIDLAKVGIIEERKFAYQKLQEFELRSRRLKHLGKWAAAQMGKSGEQAAEYVHRILGIGVSSPSDDTVVEAVHDDFVRHGVALSKAAIRSELGTFHREHDRGDESRRVKLTLAA